MIFIGIAVTRFFPWKKPFVIEHGIIGIRNKFVDSCPYSTYFWFPRKIGIFIRKTGGVPSAAAIIK
jgi:hypothetical protein